MRTGMLVYFAKAEGFELVKIGKAKHVEVRISELNTASPVPITLMAMIPETTLLKESTVHRVFSGRRERGEWFRITQSDVSLIASERSRNRLDELHILTKEGLALVFEQARPLNGTDAYLWLLELPDDKFAEIVEQGRQVKTVWNRRKRKRTTKNREDHIMAKVRRVVIESGIGQQAIGERMGYPPASARKSVSQFLSSSNPTINGLTRLADAMGVSVKSLVAEQTKC